ncbi:MULTISPECIES: LPD7 domain-containing protein [Xanthomonas]|uniref:LPD7 domain-containing protein n=1 Tax=Xanthomonas TaxID=338 RepID=UPI001C47FAD9|nr:MULTISPECIES: LPD7 domain-containing protein [Xanthomonas]MBV6855858.1 hypothetical protein [Xanthomonas campestris pv. mirabilis]MBV6867910.1 hypothetical protein [Xanthomonas campestris pv. coriandri]MCE4330830.1 hypothetical protein [Xanthomonas campestris pv. coriandri]MEA9776971.1 LPD7 domain-containing protein [Xanthomonas campestris pv. raphani]
MNTAPYPFEGVAGVDRALLQSMTREELLLASARTTLAHKRLQLTAMNLGSASDISSRAQFLRDSETGIATLLSKNPQLAGPMAQVRKWIDAATKGEQGALRSLAAVAGAKPVQEIGEKPPALKASANLGNEIEVTAGVGGTSERVKDPYDTEWRTVSPNARTAPGAMRDTGTRVQADDHDPSTVAEMLAVAEARGWSAIVVRGSDAFRRAVWMEATAKGITVTGYSPAPQDMQQATDRAAANGRLNAVDDHPTVRAFLNAKESRERQEVAANNPELRKAFAFEAALQRFANQNVQPDGREAFMDRQRANIARDLAAGKAMPNIQVREQSQRNRQQDVAVEY